MDENTLLKIAVVCSILGVAALYIISGKIDVGETPINKITSGQADGEVFVKGKVSSIRETESIMILEIEKTETIPVFIFKSKADSDSFSINKGDPIEARGKVQDYEGKKEIIASEIRAT
jgi:DNA/RNA endonuclease YhcR with UshA esterase domain